MLEIREETLFTSDSAEPEFDATPDSKTTDFGGDLF